MLGLVVARHGLADDAAHDAVGHLQHRDIHAELAAGRGDLEADVAAADDHGAMPGPRLLAQLVGIVQRLQVVDAGESGARQADAPRPAAGRQHQRVVAQVRAVVQRDAARGPVDVRRAATKPQVHAMFGIERRVPDEQAVPLECTREVLLGQRRALVGQVGLITDDGQRPAVAALPERIDELGGRLSGSEDHYAAAHGA